MKTSGEEHAAKRSAAVGKVLVALLDEKIALTAAQREKLEPIAQRLILEQGTMVNDQSSGNYDAYSPSMFYSAAAGASEDEIKAILDPQQWKRWRDAVKHPENEDMNMIETVRELPSAADASKPHPLPEPEDVELAISAFMQDKNDAQYKKTLAADLVRAEDAVRVAALSPEIAARLEVAARGQAETEMAQWNRNMESIVRSQVGQATPEDVKQRLDSIQAYQFRNRVFGGMNGQEASDNLLDKTLKTALSADQQTVWQKEVDARAAYHKAATVQMITAAFDRKVSMTPDQWQQVQKKIGDVIEKYGDVFNRYMVYQSYWYLQSYMMFLPIAAIPDTEMKQTLTPQQWDHWSGSVECSNASSNWSNVSANAAQQNGANGVVKKKKVVKPKPKSSATPAASATATPAASATPAATATPAPTATPKGTPKP
jgi:hypothetical protein